MNIMRSLLALAVVAHLAGIGRAADKPNVLFIAIDDLNDWVGPLGGHPQVKTPNLDKLAARGTTFTNAHCQAPLCNPSRTSILTGLRPTTTGVYALAPWFRTSAKLKDHATLFQWFHQHGYTTLTGGKVFHGSYPPTSRTSYRSGYLGPARRDPAATKDEVRQDARSDRAHGLGCVP